MYVSPLPEGVWSPVLTGADGKFVFKNLPSGNYTITPRSSGYQFTPAATSLRISNAPRAANFIGVPLFTISGRIATPAGQALTGVVVHRNGISGEASEITVTTNSAGYFTFANVRAGTYTLRPEKSGLAFNPITRTITISGASVGNQNFTGSPPYKISGRVATSSGVAMPGVAVTLSGRGSVTTNSAGYYTFTNVAAETYAVTPSQTGKSFTPTAKSVTVTNADLAAVNFTGM
jgi:hypothetical protein